MSASLKTIGIVAHPGRTDIKSFRLELKRWLRKRNIRILDNSEAGLESVIQSSEVIICLGGDGIILHLAGKMISRSVPVLGINMGHLGFLTGVKVSETFDELKLICNGQFETEKRAMLSCLVRNQKSRTERRFQALNDIVVNREGLTRYMMIDLKLNGESMTRFHGDGVIIATPTGSTAYSLSAGGPIVHPSLDQTVVTPICPHHSSLRPVIVSGNSRIELQITCDSEKEKALLTPDGREGLQINDHFKVEVTASTNRFLLIKSSKRTYFETLQEKFKIPI